MTSPNIIGVGDLVDTPFGKAEVVEVEQPKGTVCVLPDSLRGGFKRTAVGPSNSLRWVPFERVKKL